MLNHAIKMLIHVRNMLVHANKMLKHVNNMHVHVNISITISGLQKSLSVYVSLYIIII